MPMRSLPADQARDDVGVAGNERLTALTGAVLLVLFAVEIVTVVLLRGLMPVHFLVGVLLMGPVAVKIASTGWRLLRYYAHDPDYRRKGPPRPAMRVLSPLLLASTLAVIASGIALAVTGPAPAVLLRIHLISVTGGHSPSPEAPTRVTPRQDAALAGLEAETGKRRLELLREAIDLLLESRHKLAG